jgi:hypothetical protein
MIATIAITVALTKMIMPFTKTSSCRPLVVLMIRDLACEGIRAVTHHGKRLSH